MIAPSVCLNDRIYYSFSRIQIRAVCVVALEIILSHFSARCSVCFSIVLKQAVSEWSFWVLCYDFSKTHSWENRWTRKKTEYGNSKLLNFWVCVLLLLVRRACVKHIITVLCTCCREECRSDGGGQFLVAIFLAVPQWTHSVRGSEWCARLKPKILMSFCKCTETGLLFAPPPRVPDRDGGRDGGAN